MAGRISWLTAVLVLLSAMLAHAADGRPAKRVLFIGIDGTRTDALLAADAPNLKKLRDDGAYSYATNILGTRDDMADTVSGAGWSNLLTGVWPDKHGVLDNKFSVRNYEQYPHFFVHVKQAYPQAKTVSLISWTPIKKYITDKADLSIDFTITDKKHAYKETDDNCTAKAVDLLTNDDPDVLVYYLNQVDEAGHYKGFHPTVPEYKQAIANVDANIGEVLSALKKRPNYSKEGWLILVGTDHGGRGLNHGGNRNTSEVNTVWCIVAGDGVEKGEIKGTTHQVDLVATALTQLGIPLKPEWKLDGSAIGLKGIKQ
jgi:predicted AlkP superfamily pyrophosphatase or phosphodiesterase